MREAEKQMYLDDWSKACHICGEQTEREDMNLVSTIVPIERYDPEDPESHGPVTRYYMCCTKCKEAKILV